MSVSSVLAKDYEDKSNTTLGENKPNSKPNKPNCADARISATICPTVNYENQPLLPLPENKANSKPISEKPKTNISPIATKNYENRR